MSKVYSPADVERVEAELASALEWNKAHVTVRDEIWRAIGCGWSESVVDAAKRVVAERDAALAELAALKAEIAACFKCHADACGGGKYSCIDFAVEQKCLRPGWYALVPVPVPEDKEEFDA